MEKTIRISDPEWVDVQVVDQGANTLENYAGESAGESWYDVGGIAAMNGRYYPARLSVGSSSGVTAVTIDIDDSYSGIVELKAAENAAISA